MDRLHSPPPSTHLLLPNGQPWPVPRPLDNPADLPPLPATSDLFPTSLRWLADYIDQLAGSIQVSPLLVAPSTLAVASIAATGACSFMGRPGHWEAPVLWTMTVANPGERKSACLKMVSRPLYPVMTEPTDTSTQNDIVEMMLGTNDPSAFLITETTRAGIHEIAHLHNGRLAILTDEDHVITSLAHVHHSDALDLYLHGYGGEPIRKIVKNTSIAIRNPNIVISLCVQPDVVNTLISSNRLRGRGFSQRFLYTRAPQLPSRSYLTHQDVPIQLMSQWDSVIREINSLPRAGDDHSIELDEFALAAFAPIADAHDKERLNSETDPFIKEWSAKAAGQVLRIAGLMAMLRCPTTTTINRDEVLAAKAWVDLSLSHISVLLRSLGGSNATIQQAKRVIKYMQNNEIHQTSISSLTQTLRGTRYEKAGDWAEVFDLLEDHNWIRRLRLGEASPLGGRPCLGIKLNPRVLTSRPTA